MSRTPRQYAAGWLARSRADMRKARNCARYAQVMRNMGDDSRAEIYDRMVRVYVQSARANHRRRIGWLRMAVGGRRPIGTVAKGVQS